MESARSQNANCGLTSELLSTGSTKLSGSTLPLYASLANVVAGGPGMYLGQFTAGDTSGFLIKLAIAVWKVLDQVTSAGVAVDLLKVPNRGPTGQLIKR